MKTPALLLACSAFLSVPSAALASPGGLDPTFSPTNAANIYATALQPDGRIIIGGYFTTVNGVGRQQLARLNGNGTLDGTFTPSVTGGASPHVDAVAVQGDGKIVIAGVFTTVNGVSRNNLARLNPDGTLDSGFAATVDQWVSSISVQADGKLVLGGYFSTVNAGARRLVARIDENGTLDSGYNPDLSFLSGSGLGAVAMRADEALSVTQTYYFNGYQSRFARILNNGTLETSYALGAQVISMEAGVGPGNIMVGYGFAGGATLTNYPNILGSEQASAVALQTDGKFLIGGTFTKVDAVPCYNIARLNPDSSVDTGFNPGAASVRAITLQADGKALVFTTSMSRYETGPGTQSLAAYNRNRVQWLRGGTLPETQQVSFDLSIDGGGTWVPLGAGVRIAGGWERTGLSLPASGQIRARARVVGGFSNASSGLVETLVPFPAGPEIVVEQPAGTNVSDGGSSAFGSVEVGSNANLTFTIKNLGDFDLSGLDITIDGPDAAAFAVTANPVAPVGVPNGSTTFIVRFTPTTGGTKTAALHIASNDADENPFGIILTGVGIAPGNVDLSFNSNVTGSAVFATAVQPDGKILLGGTFGAVGGQARGNIARLGADGSVESTATFNTGAGANADVFALAVQPDGMIVLGGEFTSVKGQARNRVARLEANGNVDSGFGLGLNCNGGVLGLALQSNGSVVLVGAFTNVNAQLHNHIARVTTNGVIEIPATFNAGTGANGIVYAAVVQPDGKILIAGEFTSFDGQPRGRIARLNANGSVESTTTFNPGTGANNFVFALALAADGKIVIGGDFTSVNGQPRGRIARLNADGTVESTATFNPGTGADGLIYSIALQADGKLVLGGEFTSFDGQPRNGVARLNADGSLESTATFSTGAGADGAVYGVTLQADGKVLLGGAFANVAGQPRNLFARLANDAAVQSLTTSSTARVQWLRSGAGPEVGAVTFESSTNGGANWSALGAGTRIAGGWERTGLSLSGIGQIRARGRTMGGVFGGSNGLVEQTAAFDLITQTPILTAPTSGTASGPAVSISFALPEAALPGSVRLTFHDGVIPRVLTLAASQETQGAHSFTFDFANPTGSPQIASGPALPEGAYTVTLSYQDALGNAAASSTPATDVRLAMTPFRAWKLANLGDLNAPDLGDTDRDGLVHLAEYALVRSPTVFNAPPAVTRFTYADGQRLRMFFTRDPARNDVTIEVQAAAAPGGPWTTVATSTLGSVTIGPGYVAGDSATAGLKTVEVRDIVNISAANQRWLRVKVTH